MFETLTWAIQATVVSFVVVTVVIVGLKIAITIKEEIKEIAS